MKRKPIKNPKQIGCGYCSPIPDTKLSPETRFYPGDVHILYLTIDDRRYDFNCGERGISVAEINAKYAKELSKCKFAELKHITPLHDETYEFNPKDGNWYLVEQGHGYA